MCNIIEKPNVSLILNRNTMDWWGGHFLTQLACISMVAVLRGVIFSRTSISMVVVLGGHFFTEGHFLMQQFHKRWAMLLRSIFIKGEDSNSS